MAGLIVVAPEPLPLGPESGHDTPDLLVRWHDCADPCLSPRRPGAAPDWLHVETTGETVTYGFPGIGRIDVSRASPDVVLHPDPGTQQHTMWHLLLDQVIPLDLAERGELVLHAGSVAVGNGSARRAVLFLGESGTGKSTAALGCVLSGAALLGDDFARISLDREGAQVVPANTGVRLWEDAAAAAPAGAAAHQVAEYTSKVRIGAAAESGSHRVTEPVPIGALAVLGDRLPEGARPTVEPIAPSGAFAQVLSQAFRLDVPPPHARVQSMDQAARLVDQVPAVRVRLPESLADLAPACAQVLDRIADLAPILPGG